jgi:hypothetical protein
VILDEFYQINEDPPLTLKIDSDGQTLCEGVENDPGACPSGLPLPQAAIYTQLFNLIGTTLASEPQCLGDGNEDKKVNQEDLKNWFFFATNGIPVEGQRPNTSSWYDFNKDGYTDGLDLKIILMNFGKNCLVPKN